MEDKYYKLDVSKITDRVGSKDVVLEGLNLPVYLVESSLPNLRVNKEILDKVSSQLNVDSSEIVMEESFSSYRVVAVSPEGTPEDEYHKDIIEDNMSTRDDAELFVKRFGSKYEVMYPGMEIVVEGVL